MAQQLIFTSVPRGLRPNTRGFTTAAATASLTAPMMDRLEAMSGYTPVSAQEAPVAFSYQVARFGMQRIHILSRVSSAAADYSGRSNQIAHHLVVERTELPPGGAADVLLSGNLFHSSWVGEPQALPPVVLPRMESGPAPCAAWAKATGDAGWGGAMVRLLMGSATAPVFVVFQPGQEVLPLFAESLRLMPPARRGSVTFTTYASAQNADVECQVMGVAAGSALHQAALKTHPARVLDLAKMLVSPAPQDAFTEAARQGEMYQVAQVAPVKQVETKAAVVGAVKPPPMRGDFAPLMEDVEKGEPEWLALRRGPVPIRRKSKMGWVWAAVAGVLVLVGVGGVLVMGKEEKKKEKEDVVAVVVPIKTEKESVSEATKEVKKKEAVMAIAPKEDPAAAQRIKDQKAVDMMKAQWNGKKIDFSMLLSPDPKIQENLVATIDPAFVQIVWMPDKKVLWKRGESNLPWKKWLFADAESWRIGKEAIEEATAPVKSFESAAGKLILPGDAPPNQNPDQYSAWQKWRKNVEVYVDARHKVEDIFHPQKWDAELSLVGKLEYQTKTQGLVANISVDIRWEQLFDGNLASYKSGIFDMESWKNKFVQAQLPEDFGPCLKVVKFGDLSQEKRVDVCTISAEKTPSKWSVDSDKQTPFTVWPNTIRIKDSQCIIFKDKDEEVCLAPINQARTSPTDETLKDFTIQMKPVKPPHDGLYSAVVAAAKGMSIAVGKCDKKQTKHEFEDELKQAKRTLDDAIGKYNKASEEEKKACDEAKKIKDEKQKTQAIAKASGMAAPFAEEKNHCQSNYENLKGALEANTKLRLAIAAWKNSHPNTSLVFYDKAGMLICHIRFELDPIPQLTTLYPDIKDYLK